MSTLSMTEAKNKRKTIKSTCTRMKNFLESTDPDQLSRFDLTERIKKLSLLWDQYDDTQTRIETLNFIDLSDGDQSALNKQHSDERANFETPYFNLVARFEEKLHAIERRENFGNAIPQNSVTQSRNNSTSSQLRLPKIELPVFSGNCEDWYAFFDTFEKLINANPDLSEIQKFHYLKSSLKSEAAEVVKAFEISTENYKQAWELLIERYDNRRRIVQGHIKSLFDLPSISKENYKQLRLLLDGVCKHLRALRALERPVDTWDDLVIHLIISKLDATTKREWETSRTDSSIPNFKQLKDFFLQRCLALEVIASKPVGNNTLSQKTKGTVANTAITNLICRYYKENHPLYQCDLFKKLPVEERFKIVKDSRLCINCLKTNSHQAKNCPSSSCLKCQKAHNTLLHFSSNTVQDKPATVSDSKETSTPVVTQCVQQNPSRVLLSTAIVHVYDSNGKTHTCRALLDSGSQLSFVTEGFVKTLHLNKQSINMPIMGIAEGSFKARNMVNLTIQSRFNSYREKLNCIVLPRITQKLPQNFIHPLRFKIPTNIQLADPSFNVPSDIDLLIGADIFWQLTCIGQIKGCNDHPTLQKTKFGWILSGHIVNTRIKKNSVSCHLVTLDDLDQTISKFWQIENNYHNNSKGYSAEETACEALFQRTTVRNSEGRFVVNLPIKDNVISQLGESREIVERRFFALERRLSKQSAIYDEYRNFMRNYKNLNHMRQIEDTANRDSSIHYYLPHHAVFKDTSTTTRLRVVFDASCKTHSGISLNDALLIGPTVQQDLFSILSCFRTFPIAMTADITKMYWQVLVDPSQRCLQRILWRNNQQYALQTFELFTVTYGMAPASFLAIRSLSKLAEDESKSYPLGAKIILRDFYVDDMLSGASTIDEALKAKDQTCNLLQCGGFELRKWFSNSPLLRDNNSIPEKMIDLHSEHNKTRALGVIWHCERDTFNFTISSEHQPLTRLTKQNILSRIALIFDPLGFLGPVILIGKLIIQELWALKID